MPEKTLNHYLSLRFTPAYWELPPDRQADFFPAFARELQSGATCANFYQTAALQAEGDFLVWSAAPLDDPADEARIFASLGRALSARRRWIEPAAALWGYTRPSIYARNAASAQEIDPLDSRRSTYLVLYPFVKTIQWYLLGKDTRQGMMNEHIRIGRQYPEIKQLLLYSFGVQDQEFIVVYEMETLYRFSELVNELRGSDVREYTERDTPVYTGIWHSPEEMSALFTAQDGRQ